MKEIERKRRNWLEGNKYVYYCVSIWMCCYRITKFIKFNAFKTKQWVQRSEVKEENELENIQKLRKKRILMK